MSIEMEQILAASVIKFVGAIEMMAVAATLVGLVGSVFLMWREVRRTGANSASGECALDAAPKQEAAHGSPIALTAIVFALTCCIAHPSLVQGGEMNCDAAVCAANVPVFVQALMTTRASAGVTCSEPMRMTMG